MEQLPHPHLAPYEQTNTSEKRPRYDKDWPQANHPITPLPFAMPSYLPPPFPLFGPTYSAAAAAPGNHSALSSEQQHQQRGNTNDNNGTEQNIRHETHKEIQTHLFSPSSIGVPSSVVSRHGRKLSVGPTPLEFSSPSPALASMRVKVACSNCKASKTKCDTSRPCGRCIRTDRIQSCCDPLLPGQSHANTPTTNNTNVITATEQINLDESHGHDGLTSPLHSYHPGLADTTDPSSLVMQSSTSAATGSLLPHTTTTTTTTTTITTSHGNNINNANGRSTFTHTQQAPQSALVNSLAAGPTSATNTTSGQQYDTRRSKQDHLSSQSHPYTHRPPLPMSFPMSVGFSLPHDATSPSATPSPSPFPSAAAIDSRRAPLSQRGQLWFTTFLEIFLQSLQSWHHRLTEDKTFELGATSARNSMANQQSQQQQTNHPINTNPNPSPPPQPSAADRIHHASLLVRRSKFFADLIMTHINGFSATATSSTATTTPPHAQKDKIDSKRSAAVQTLIQSDKDVYSGLNVSVLSMSIGSVSNPSGRSCWCNSTLSNLLGYPDPAPLSDLLSSLEGASLIYPLSNLKVTIPAFMDAVFTSLSTYPVHTEWIKRDGTRIDMIESVNLQFDDAEGGVARATTLMYPMAKPADRLRYPASSSHHPPAAATPRYPPYPFSHHDPTAHPLPHTHPLAMTMPVPMPMPIQTSVHMPLDTPMAHARDDTQMVIDAAAAAAAAAVQTTTGAPHLNASQQTTVITAPSNADTRNTSEPK